MPDQDIDRPHLSQAPTGPELRELLREAKAHFSPEARAAKREAEAERVRTMRAAHRAAKRLPTKIANRRDRNLRHRTKLALAMKLEDQRVAILIASTPCKAEALTFWLTTSGREQAKARELESQEPGGLMVTREAMLCAREQGVAVSWKGYADAFAVATGRPWSREQARRRVAFLTKLEGPGGPW